VVLSGSYRRDPEGLRAAYDQLCAEDCEVASPLSVDFVKEIDGFVVSALELTESPADIEARHIAALREADFVWLHVPDGYVGPSGALEIGVAHCLGIPVYAATAPSDNNLAQFVVADSTPHLAVAAARADGPRVPASVLCDLQHYYARAAADRGFDEESPQDTMLLLIEEIGELARSIRKSIGLSRADGDVGDVAYELADVQLYVLHLANVIGLDLAGAVIAKEQLNRRRYGPVAA
jgi:NTP pyrophosphatase (non-canonical NTP hydrolase)/nucleoside 2-deoxyribosyltransferase